MLAIRQLIMATKGFRRLLVVAVLSVFASSAYGIVIENLEREVRSFNMNLCVALTTCVVR